MEHLIQFGVTIDDEKIEKMVMDKASTEAMKKISDEVYKFTRNSYGESELTRLFKSQVVQLVNQNKEEIIEKAVNIVAANLMKTKAIAEAKVKLVSQMESCNE